MDKPAITYPCSWSYRLIGEDKELMLREIPAKMGGIRHEVSISNQSSGGRYISINIDAFVQSEAERLSVVQMLRSIPTVKMVI